MTHLGDAASALVDGELDAETTRHALAHVAGCRCCKAAVDAERTLKAQLARDPVLPELPSGLLDSLLSLAVRVELSQRAGSAMGAPGSVALAMPAAPTGATAFVSAQASSRRPPWRSVRAAPRGRADSAGPGRLVRGRPHGTYVAAAGLAASVMVGLGGGTLAGTAGSAAHAPSGPNASTSSIATASPVASPSASTSGAVAVPSSAAPIPSIDARSIVRTQSRSALSVIYRRP